MGSVVSYHDNDWFRSRRARQRILYSNDVDATWRMKVKCDSEKCLLHQLLQSSYLSKRHHPRASSTACELGRGKAEAEGGGGGGLFMICFVTPSIVIVLLRS